jgi:hypothetical protein
MRAAVRPPSTQPRSRLGPLRWPSSRQWRGSPTHGIRPHLVRNDSLREDCIAHVIRVGVDANACNSTSHTPDADIASVRNGAKTIHSSSVSKLRTKADLRPNEQPQIMLARVGGIPRSPVCPSGLVDTKTSLSHPAPSVAAHGAARVHNVAALSAVPMERRPGFGRFGPL